MAKKRRGRGEGGLYQRRSDGLWIGAVVVGYDENGNPKRKTVSHKLKEEARKLLQELQQKHGSGRADAGNMTVESLFKLWLDTEVKDSVDPATQRVHEQRVKDYILPSLGTIKLEKLTRVHPAELQAELQKDGRSADLRKKVGQLLRRVLHRAREYNLVSENVAMYVKLPRVEREEPHHMTPLQVGQFLQVAQKHRYYPLFRFALETGARQGEIMALEWPDVDLAAGTVFINKSVQTDMRGAARVKSTKTKASRRKIRIGPSMVALLAAWKLKTPGSLVFPNRKGKHFRKSNLRITFKRLLRKAKLPEFRFHDLRHTFATLALLETKDIKAVSKRLGHRDTSVTLNIYAHFLPETEQAIVEAMENLLVPSQVIPAAAGNEGTVAAVA
jgi:integrase